MSDRTVHYERNGWRRIRLALLLGAVLAGGTGACGESDAEPVEAAEGAAAAGEEHAGETDALVLDSAGMSAAGIQVNAVETVTTTGLPVTGTITYDANLVSHVGARAEGRIVRLNTDIGDRVRSGQVLALLESPEVGSLRAEEHEAEALLRIARENYQREQRLEEQGISSRKELLDAEAELRRAEAALRSAEERLRVLGAGHGSGGQFAVTAPFAGVVVARDAGRGEVVSPADSLFTVANLDRMWIELDVFERDLARIGRGQAVEVTTAAYPGRTFPGRIVYVGDVLDPATRTVRARVEIPNEDRALKPGMFATARIQVGGGGAPTVVLPRDAIQELEGRKVVFVPGDRPGEFRAVPVELGETVDGGRVVVRSGLEPGTRVVTAGAFALRSELAKGEIGEHGH
ncbi:efflux RND transporter periplasmic adaptor subunit [soil metagenome]